jgi:hypothetical protein
MSNRKPINEQGRQAQADCIRRFGAAEFGEHAEQCARDVEAGNVEYDPEWLEGLVTCGRERAAGPPPDSML